MTAPASTPQGRWDCTVRRPKGDVEETMHFTADGRVFLTSRGAGRWYRTSPGRFVFTLAEPVLDDTQTTLIAWVDVEQEAFQLGDTFASSGITVVRNADGVESARIDVSVVACREAHVERERVTSS